MRRATCHLATILIAVLPLAGQEASKPSPINLPTSKSLAPAPGVLAALNSFPATIALSPDGQFAAMLHSGYGTQKSRGCQSISVFDLQTGKITDFPDDRLCEDAHQSYFLGLTFSADGRHLYASLGSITDPTGSRAGDTGNAIAVYAFDAGKINRERLIKIPPQSLASGKWVARGVFKTARGTAIPYPAGLAIVPGAKTERLLVANNLSDNVILLDTGSGEILEQFDLSTSKFVPASYPYAVVVSRDGQESMVQFVECVEDR